MTPPGPLSKFPGIERGEEDGEDEFDDATGERSRTEDTTEATEADFGTTMTPDSLLGEVRGPEGR